VLRGSLAGLPVGGPGELCLAMALEDTSLVDPDAPSAGAGFFYLVRGHNVCGSGSYGTSSDGQPRTTAACP